MVAAESATVNAVVPIPGLDVAVDLTLLTNEVSLYRSQLGLPDENSHAFQQMTPANQEKVRKFLDAEQVAALLKDNTARSTAGEFVRFIPFIGLAIARGISFSSTYNFLHECLNEMEQVALICVDEMNANTVGDFDLD